MDWLVFSQYSAPPVVCQARFCGFTFRVVVRLTLMPGPCYRPDGGAVAGGASARLRSDSNAQGNPARVSHTAHALAEAEDGLQASLGAPGDA